MRLRKVTLETVRTASLATRPITRTAERTWHTPLVAERADKVHTADCEKLTVGLQVEVEQALLGKILTKELLTSVESKCTALKRLNGIATLQK